MVQQILDQPVVRYLHDLELVIKQKVGVVPEDVLTDAREFLFKDAQSLRQSEPGIGDQEVYEHIVATFGDPEAVAQQYEDEADSNRPTRTGYAPNWRICCTKCGRSAPADRAGITRIAARSSQKFVLGWCPDCRWLRWLRLVRDLDKTNLSDQLGMDVTGPRLREKTYKPWAVIFSILAFVALLLLMSYGLKPIIEAAAGVAAPNQLAAEPNIDSVFKDMPEGWSVVSQIVIPRSQLAGFSQKLGGTIRYADNTVISDGARQLQINVLQCPTEKDAAGVYQALLKLKGNPQHVARNDKSVFELMCHTSEQARFAAEARCRLPILPASAKYRVKFDLAPLEAFDAMSWNKMYNLFLRWEAANTSDHPDRAAVEAQIAELSKQFQFGDSVQLKNSGLGTTLTSWQFSPEPTAKTATTAANSADATVYRFQNLPQRAGIPVVSVEAMITSSTLATTPLVDAASRTKSLQPNEYWPSDAAEIRALAAEITRGADTDPQKVKALLRWLGDPRNLRFGGPELGSRYGTEQVLKQKFGHCWDYSDVFITLCRAGGIPARQVIGWLHNGPGHVWAEVAMDGRWHPLDPTSGAGCGSDYLPFVVSDDAPLSFVYVSPVKIELLEAN